jgi:hypothetical protein
MAIAGNQSGSSATGRKRQKNKSSKKELRASEKAFERLDLRKELVVLEEMISHLKVEYEQYFLGIITIRPDKLNADVKRKLRTIRNAPFKQAWVNYKLRSLESRYHTFNDYWERCNRQKEDGTYFRDVFKANLREKNALEDARANTDYGKASKHMTALFDTYKRALEKQTGRKQEIDIGAFQKALKKKAKAHRDKFGEKKLGFKVVVKNGKVSIKARAVEG